MERDRHLDELAKDPEAAWAQTEQLISTKQPARYDTAVTLLADLRDLARRETKTRAFTLRLAALRDAHRSKPSLMARLDRAGLTS